jgi:hypothetical protein
MAPPTAPTELAAKSLGEIHRLVIAVALNASTLVDLRILPKFARQGDGLSRSLPAFFYKVNVALCSG